MNYPPIKPIDVKQRLDGRGRFTDLDHLYTIQGTEPIAIDMAELDTWFAPGVVTEESEWVKL